MFINDENEFSFISYSIVNSTWTGCCLRTFLPHSWNSRGWWGWVCYWRRGRSSWCPWCGCCCSRCCWKEPSHWRECSHSSCGRWWTVRRAWRRPWSSQNISCGPYCYCYCSIVIVFVIVPHVPMEVWQVSEGVPHADGSIKPAGWSHNIVLQWEQSQINIWGMYISYILYYNIYSIFIYGLYSFEYQYSINYRLQTQSSDWVYKPWKSSQPKSYISPCFPFSAALSCSTAAITYCCW